MLEVNGFKPILEVNGFKSMLEVNGYQFHSVEIPFTSLEGFNYEECIQQCSKKSLKRLIEQFERIKHRCEKYDVNTVMYHSLNKNTYIMYILNKDRSGIMMTMIPCNILFELSISHYTIVEKIKKWLVKTATKPVPKIDPQFIKKPIL